MGLKTNENQDISQYLDEIEEKVKKVREKDSPDTPKIGIFWLCIRGGKVDIFHSEPISLVFGQEYGSFIVAPREHYNTWESLKRHKIIPINSNYEYLPRGRVAYDNDKKQYVVYHGKYINSTSGIKSVIKEDFKLKRNTRWEPDLHYHQFKRWGV